MIVKAPHKYEERIANLLEWFGLLVVKKAWLMCPYKVTVDGPSETASSPLKNCISNNKISFVKLITDSESPFFSVKLCTSESSKKKLIKILVPKHFVGRFQSGRFQSGIRTDFLATYC